MMKKLCTFLALVTLVFSLSACRENPYEDDKDTNDDIIVVDPDKPIVNPEVDKPKPKPEPEVEKPKPEEDKTPEENLDKPEIEKPTKPEIDKNPVIVDGIRRYKPGTYVRDYKDSFVILFVDDYGRIANVYLDELLDEKDYYQDSNHNLYLYLKEDETYHYIKDGNYSETLSSLDLISGVHDNKIKDLKRASVYDTKYLLGDLYQEEGRSYKSQMDILTDRIILDNGIYGINVYLDDNKYYTDNVRGVKVPIGNFMKMLEDILYLDARLTDKNDLKDLKDPSFGLYEEGRYLSASNLKYNEYLDEFVLDFIIYNVDEFGSIASLYADSTSSDVLLSLSKNSLEDNLSNFTNTLKNNQNINFLKKTNLDNNHYYTDSISGVTIDLKPYLTLLETSLKDSIFENYLDGFYLISNKDYNTYFNIINHDIVTVTLDIFDERSSFKEDLTKDLYTSLDLNNFDLNYDDEKIINKKVDCLDKPLVEDITKALFEVRDEDYLSKPLGYNFTNLLASGAYYIESSNYYMYVYYLDNHITTLVLDSKEGTFRNTRVTRLDKEEEQLLDLANLIIDNQSYIIDMMAGDFEYDRIKSLIDITEDKLFSKVNIPLSEVDELLREFIYQASNAKLDEEMSILENALKDYINAKPIIDGLVDIPLSLPASSFALSKELANRYTLSYDLRDSYLDLDMSNKNFIGLELRKDIPRSTTSTLDVEVKDQNKDVVYEFSVEIPLYSLEDASKILFNEESISKLILTGTKVYLPYKENSELKYKDLKYVSSGTNVSMSENYFSSNTSGNNIIKAYIDKNENKKFDSDELIREFEVTFLDDREAYKYLEDNFSLANVYQEVREDFVLTSKTGIYGINAKYDVSRSFENILTLEEQEDGSTIARVIRPASTKEVYINVNFTGIDKQKKYYFDVVKRDAKSNYEYALETVNSFDVSGIDLDRVVYGTDFKFDEYLQNLKYFDYDKTSKGEIYAEDVDIIVSDFGKYINEYTGEVYRITDNLTTDINLEIKLSASYPTKKASDREVAERVIEITLIPKPDIEEIIKDDASVFKDFSVDISQNLEKSVIINLPTTGKSGLSKITYSMDSNDDIYTLNENRLIVNTSNKDNFVNNYDKTFDLEVKVSYGGYNEYQTIKLRVKE